MPCPATAQQHCIHASPSLGIHKTPELVPATSQLGRVAQNPSPCIVLGEGTQPVPCPMATCWRLAPTLPKRSCLEPGSRWQPSLSRTGSTGTGPGRAASSRPALRPSQLVTPATAPAPAGMAGHDAASLAAHPSAPRPPQDTGQFSPIPSSELQRDVPVHTGVTLSVTLGAEAPRGDRPRSLPPFPSGEYWRRRGQALGGCSLTERYGGCWKCHAPSAVGTSQGGICQAEYGFPAPRRATAPRGACGWQRGSCQRNLAGTYAAGGGSSRSMAWGRRARKRMVLRPPRGTSGLTGSQALGKVAAGGTGQGPRQD